MMAKRIAAILVIMVLFAGCAARENAAYQRDGEQYGITKGTFRGRWWSYYERGSSFLAGKFYEEALRDFEAALQGRGSDTWRARTYGLHFVEFFPNREIGVTYYQLGRLDEAERYLTLALQQVDTERTHHYLDLVKKARIANGTLKDQSDPVLDTTIGEPVVIASALPTVSIAKAEPPAPISSKPEPIAEAKPAPKPVAAKPAAAPAPASKAKPEPKPAPKAEAATKAEPKPATTVAPKAAPKAEPAKDAEPPKVAAAKTVEAAKPAEAPKVPEAAKPAPVEIPANAKVITEPTLPVQIAANDDVGVVKVAVNGRQLPQRGSAQQIKFRDDIVVKEGVQQLAVVATDLADKKTSTQLAVVVDLTGPTIGVYSPVEPTVTPDGSVVLDGASVDAVGVASVAVGDRRIAESPGGKKLPFNTELPLGNGENVFVLAARDTGGNETRSAVKVFRGDPNSREAKLWLLEQKRPDLFVFASNGSGDVDELLRIAQGDAARQPINEIRLKSPVIDQPYRHSRTLRVSGDVVTSSAVESITINGEPVGDLTGAPKESFNKRIPIDQDVFNTGIGKMDLEIVAIDVNGGRLEKRFEIELAPVELAGPGSHMPIAVLAFAGAGIDPSVAEGIRAETEAAFVAQKRFHVLDRAALEGVLSADQVSAALGNPDEAINLGGSIPAQLYLVSDLFTHDDNGLEIKARVVSTETGALVATLDTYVEDKSDPELLRYAGDDLAAQLTGIYPRLSGEVIRVAGNEVVLDWSAEDGARVGSLVLLLQSGDAWLDPDTQEILEPGELREAARARIVEVSATETRAVIVERKEEGAPVEQGMPAITM